MKRIRINFDQVGLVSKNGGYNRCLTQGVYWIFPNERVDVYNKSQPFNPNFSLDILLRDSYLKALLTIINVGDNEIVLHYENNNFKEVLTPGRYAFWMGLVDNQFITADISKTDITESININTIKRQELANYIRVCKIDTYEKGVLFIDNKFHRMLTSGDYYFWKNATEVSVIKVDMRQVQLEISGQEILTKDKANLRITFYTQYKVVDILKAVTENKDYEKQLYVFIQFALRAYIGSMTLDELLENKESIADYVKLELQEKAKNLGVEIVDCGIKDVILPGEMKEIMNKVLIAQKQAQANLILRREETASTRNLLNTAKLMEDNEMLFKLKEMEYVEKIADKIGEITVSGNGQILNQLKSIFTVTK